MDFMKLQKKELRGNRLIDEFAEKVFSTEHSFSLKRKRGCFFIQSNVGMGRYVYSICDGDLHMDVTQNQNLAAIVADGKIYIIDESFLEVNNQENLQLPENTYCFANIPKDERIYVESVIFPKFHGLLEETKQKPLEAWSKRKSFLKFKKKRGTGHNGIYK